MNPATCDGFKPAGVDGHGFREALDEDAIAPQGAQKMGVVNDHLLGLSEGNAMACTCCDDACSKGEATAGLGERGAFDMPDADLFQFHVARLIELEALAKVESLYFELRVVLGLPGCRHHGGVAMTYNPEV